MEDVFCAQRSREVGEAIGGTAVERTTLIVALEVRSVWPKKILKGSALDPDVEAHLRELEEATPELRVQFVKPLTHELEEPGVQLFVADVRPASSRLWALSLDDQRDLLELDLLGFRDAPPPGAVERDTPLLLVCTHGKRDRCCAREGMEMVRALVDAPGSHHAWQTSHLGGHRFAATTLALPGGYCHGRLRGDDAAPLLEATLDGQLYRPDRLRGRICYSRPAQAAEAAILKERPELAPGALRLISERGEGEGRWRIVFELEGSGPIARLVEARELAETAPGSCGKPATPVTNLAVGT